MITNHGARARTLPRSVSRAVARADGLSPAVGVRGEAVRVRAGEAGGETLRAGGRSPVLCSYPHPPRPRE